MSMKTPDAVGYINLRGPKYLARLAEVAESLSVAPDIHPALGSALAQLATVASHAAVVRAALLDSHRPKVTGSEVTTD
jgi:hypothetical protein